MNTRIRFKTVLAFAVVAMAVIGLATNSAIAAGELTHDATVKIYEGTPYNVSVYPGKALYSGYDGTVTGTFGDGTVLDYRFFNATAYAISSYADGGAGIIAPVPSPASEYCNGGAISFCSVWTTTDPNADFGAPANYTAPTSTMAKAQGFTGTIDISNLRSGTVYFNYATYEDYTAVYLTMSGAGQPELTAEHWENPGLIWNGWISSFRFSNETGDYDTISYTYVNNDLDGSRAGFGFVIVDGIEAFGPTNMYPENGSVIAPGDVVLSWTNLDPCAPPAPTYVDVLFGSDPNSLALVPGAIGAAIETITVSDPGLGTFFWRVDSYTNGSPTGVPTAGPLMSFTNDGPVSVELSDKITWSGKGFQPAPSIADDGSSALTYLWTADLPIGVTVEFDPSDNIENPIITLTKVADLVPFVTNGGFEDPILVDGVSVNTGSVSGWNTMWTSIGSGTWLDDGSPDAGAVNPVGDVAPEGINVGHSPTDPLNINSLYQVLADVVEANTTYELRVKVGNTSGAATAGYIIELVTGDMAALGDGSSVIVASATGASPADETTWITATAIYTSGADAVADPSIGKPILIRLSADAFTAGSTVNFDDVKLLINGEEGVNKYVADMSTVKLTLTVTDETNPTVTGTMTVDVYDTACKAAIGTGSSSVSDFNGDCVTDLVDFAEMAANWLDDTSYTQAMPKL